MYSSPLNFSFHVSPYILQKFFFSFVTVKYIPPADTFFNETMDLMKSWHVS